MTWEMGKMIYKGKTLKQHKTLGIFYKFKMQQHEAFLLHMEIL